MAAGGSQFRKVFVKLTSIRDVNIERSVVESHNILGIGEVYQKTLDDIFRKLKLDHAKVQKQILLTLAIKAMNDTLGPGRIATYTL